MGIDQRQAYRPLQALAAEKTRTASEIIRRLFKKAVQRGRSERKAGDVRSLYVEALSDARTKLEDFFNSLPSAMRAKPRGTSRQ